MEPEPQNDLHDKFMNPLVLGTTLIAWLEALLEAATLGGMHAPELWTNLYLTVMSGYVVGVEVQKWKQATPADPACDPMSERAQRSGVILVMWWVLFLGIHFWRYRDPSVPMPASVMPILMGMTLLFIGKRVSRHVRRTQRGVGGPASLVDLDGDGVDGTLDQEQLSAALAQSPTGLTLQEIEDALPELSRTGIKRALRALVASHQAVRDGQPRSRDARYRSTKK